MNFSSTLPQGSSKPPFVVLVMSGAGNRWRVFDAFLRSAESRLGEPIMPYIDLCAASSASGPMMIYATQPENFSREPGALMDDIRRKYERLETKLLKIKLRQLFYRRATDRVMNTMQSVFGDARLNESRIPLMIATCDKGDKLIGHKSAVFLTSHDFGLDDDAYVYDENLKAYKAAAAAVMIPFVRRPAHICERRLIDGGKDSYGFFPVRRAVAAAEKLKEPGQDIWVIGVLPGFRPLRHAFNALTQLHINHERRFTQTQSLIPQDNIHVWDMYLGDVPGVPYWLCESPVATKKDALRSIDVAADALLGYKGFQDFVDGAIAPLHLKKTLPARGPDGLEFVV